MRRLDGLIGKFMYLYVLGLGLFHVYTSVFGAFEAYLQRNLHLAMVMPLAFVFYPMGRRSPMDRVPLYDWILAGLSTLPGLYVAFNYEEITSRIIQVDPVTQVQLVLGILLFVLLMEATRRVVGLPLMVISCVFAAYMLLGDKMPGIMRGLSFPLSEVVEQLYLTDEGIFSMPLGVSATVVAAFLIFGGFLEKCGTGPYFMEVAQAFTGTAPGGPANIAVMSSCLFGSISGSAVANVYGTGTFTIPMMKRIGYEPHFAGAVEAVASTGGQIMPPVMGAGAFLMASFLGVPFAEVMVAAIVPALIYYGAVFLMVRLEAQKRGMKGLPPEELPDRKRVLRGIYLFIPIAVLVYLLMSGRSPMYSAMMGALLSWLVSLPKRETRMGLRRTLDAIHDGIKNITLVCVACASAGVALSSVSLTGIGQKLVSFVLSFASGVPLLALVLVMLVSLVLGMGLPTTGAYILASALGVPILSNLGYPLMAAHMFVFYYAIISNITPPVALAAYAASSIAGSDPNRTGFTASILGALAFVTPFAFCYDQGILLQGTWAQNVWGILSCVAAVFAIGFGIMGYCQRTLIPLERGLFLVLGLACLVPNHMVTIGGILGTGALYAAISRGIRGSGSA
ncbi:TRAP transporter, 4TM/12TM fusion protein [Thermanaerovibrio acidaminovorans DSM 6589]|uniref:TRAP transporter, 4TM/12TM fusion protein n=1 Tax=Thermanaerovibrio acidaminovorans (strain ATCC 49978 / DSM 6589 / Su883) TaxID=525903 RepID=D1B6Q5_THEAS|nr:TRAP transporter fused permease subunit [Thermanaerovibrio acidaminovorans]ACZ19696.1 TRAP transporter, 4TM/12TM fusion protein [Thermanaerovibrio acidaminovorans DSM 6589]